MPLKRGSRYRLSGPTAWAWMTESQGSDFSFDDNLESMLRIPCIWLLCFGLALSRLLGLHVHACTGIEGTPHQHEATHYADSGLVFGESHAGDDADNLELDLASAIPVAQIALDSSVDPVIPTTDQNFVPAASGWMTVRAPRGPPNAREVQPAHFAPPLRGPPSISLA